MYRIAYALAIVSMVNGWIGYHLLPFRFADYPPDWTANLLIAWGLTVWGWPYITLSFLGIGILTMPTYANRENNK